MFLNMFGQVNAIGETEIPVGAEIEWDLLRIAIAKFALALGRREAGMRFFDSQRNGFA